MYPPAKVHDAGRVARPLDVDTVTVEVEAVPGQVKTPPDTVKVIVPVQLVIRLLDAFTTATVGEVAKVLPDTPAEGCVPPP